MDLYTPLLYYWARRMGLQQQDAADLVQDVFTVLVQKMPEFRYDQQGSFRSWLRTVTLNKWRERQRRRVEVSLGSDASAIANVAAPDDVAAFDEDGYQVLPSKYARQDSNLQPSDP